MIILPLSTIQSYPRLVEYALLSFKNECDSPALVKFGIKCEAWGWKQTLNTPNSIGPDLLSEIAWNPEAFQRDCFCSVSHLLEIWCSNIHYSLLISVTWVGWKLCNLLALKIYLLTYLLTWILFFTKITAISFTIHLQSDTCSIGLSCRRRR